MSARPGWSRRLLAAAGAAAAVIYLLNPAWGIFELIPDVLPIVGNLDEASAAALLFACLRALRHKPGELERPEVSRYNLPPH
jgi:uncharacterized membrane protein YkvA (DUF1232 family)